MRVRSLALLVQRYLCMTNAIVTLLVRMYLAAVSDPCQAQRLAAQDFYASGACTWDVQSEDAECTETADAVLADLFQACPENLISR